MYNCTTVKSRQSAPTSSTLQVGRGGWASPACRIQCYMKKYSPYENCACISYTDQRSRARSRTDPTKRRVCAIPGQEGGHCCVHFQRGRARVCSAVRHHRLQQSHTRIQSITSLTRSQGGADGRDGVLWRDFTVLLTILPGCANHCSIFLLYIDKHSVCEILLYYFLLLSVD